jgi:hypothetical protein
MVPKVKSNRSAADHDYGPTRSLALGQEIYGQKENLPRLRQTQRRPVVRHRGIVSRVWQGAICAVALGI